jgi:tetratricopeptide (TPR) repeat protein
MAEEKRNESMDAAGLYEQAEKYVKENKQVVTYIVGGLILVIMAYFSYGRFIVEPKEEKAANQVFRAQSYFAVDSLRLALHGDGLYPGFLKIIEDYDGTKVANLSNYYAGLCYLRSGQYNDAINYLKDYSGDDAYVQTLAYGAIGDAYGELGNLGDAISWYKKAADNQPNDLLTPFFLYKSGLAMEREGDNSGALKAFERIRKNYPNSPEGADIEKYISRVSAKN